MKKQKRIYDQSYIKLKEPLCAHNNILNSDEHDEKIKKKKKEERKINKHSYENISDSTNLSTNKYYINDSKKKEKKENNKIHKMIRHKIGMLFERIKKKTKRKKKEEKHTQMSNCNNDDNNNNNNNNNNNHNSNNNNNNNHNNNNNYYYNSNKFYDYFPNIENIKIKNINRKHIKNIYNNTKDKLTKKRYQTTNHNTIHLNKNNEYGMLLYNIKNILNLNNDDINNLIKISNFDIDLDMDTFYHTFVKNNNSNNNNNNINILNYNINHNKNIYDIKDYTNDKNERVIQYKQNSSLYLGVSVCNISIAESSYFLYNKNVKYKYTPSHHVTNQNYFNNNKATNINNIDYFKDKSKEQYSDINTQIKTHLYYQHPYDNSICFLSSCNKEHIITNKQDINNQQHDIKNELGKENHQNICSHKNYGTYYYHKTKYIYHRNDNPISTNFYQHNNKKKKKNYKHNIDNRRKYKSTIIHFFKKKFLRIKKKKKETKKISKTRSDETIYIHKNIEQHKNYKKQYSDIYRNENINYEIKKEKKYIYNNNIKKKLRFIINKLFLEKSKEKKTNKPNIVQGQKNDLPYISNKYLDPKFNELYYIQMINVYNEPFSIYIKIYQIYIFSKKTKNIKHFVDNDIYPNNIQTLTSNKEKTNVSIYVLIDIQNNFLKYIIKKKIITEIQDCLQNWEKYIITHIQKMRGIHNNNDDNYNNFISLSNVQHFLSIIFTIPFLTINLATFSFNFYPSKGFVGNTLTYFCGMFLAVVSIFGHFSKTLVLFLIPQFLNFFISLPQLFHIIPCPRHRLPIINYKTNKLMYSHNYTLINLILYLFGPLSEYHLVLILLTFQFLTCSFGLFLRYYI
ncbi:hypothetical protein PFNF135_00628 [Plasmodium falciparum NF135/5.C10]|nr:hypothetical protein PFNF135_00628 [Plasmodium falciparum NF135/5.C10]